MDIYFVLIVKLLFLAFCQSSATLFITQNIRNGRIFSFYGSFLAMIKVKSLRKILGECPFCFNFYLGIALYLLGREILSIGLEWQWYWHVLAYSAVFSLSNSMLSFLLFNSPFTEE